LSNKITKGKGTLTLQGSGDETRDFIYIDDLCAAVAILVEKGKWGCGIYNVASGVEVPIRELAELLCQSYGFDPDLRFEGKLPPGVPKRWVADISQLSALGFQPSIGIEEGLAAYAKWAGSEVADSASS
jgi:nucleoside-diphosphate-sugar epimerase